MDDLATGSCAIACFFYLLIGFEGNDPFLVSVSFPLLGACLGFLIHNFHSTRVFLGDRSAIFLGFLLEFMGLRVANNENLLVLKRWMLPIQIFSVLIFDTTLVTFSRLKRKIIPFLLQVRTISIIVRALFLLI
jgi:UDP-GlcNAc:undecaprenyl-phosphate GlcNAc-1-phosphate transferase